MKAQVSFKKQVKVNVKSSAKGALLKFPKQSIGTVWLESESGAVVKQWNLIIEKSGSLKVEQI